PTSARAAGISDCQVLTATIWAGLDESDAADCFRRVKLPHPDSEVCFAANETRPAVARKAAATFVVFGEVVGFEAGNDERTAGREDASEVEGEFFGCRRADIRDDDV